MSRKSTSWEKASAWYDQIVGHEGHHYHRLLFSHLLPRILEKKEGSLLDLACGQGVLARLLPASWHYVGLDISPSLIQAAKQKIKNSSCHFFVRDITKPLSLPKEEKFTTCTIILALQNLKHPLLALKQAATHLLPGGSLHLVINHPCFRIPKLSHWGLDGDLQYRRMDAYMSSITIPIQLHPSQGIASPTTLSFHHSLSTWSAWLEEAGFVIQRIEEWVSDKVSTGACAKRENTSRAEFPLFLAIHAIIDTQIDAQKVVTGNPLSSI